MEKAEHVQQFLQCTDAFLELEPALLKGARDHLGRRQEFPQIIGAREKDHRKTRIRQIS